jgi:hypothetical protein
MTSAESSNVRTVETPRSGMRRSACLLVGIAGWGWALLVSVAWLKVVWSAFIASDLTVHPDARSYGVFAILVSGAAPTAGLLGARMRRGTRTTKFVTGGVIAGIVALAAATVIGAGPFDLLLA